MIVCLSPDPQWFASEFLKTRVATGLCSRHLAAEACPYANMCETCENYIPIPEIRWCLRRRRGRHHRSDLHMSRRS